MFDVDKEYLMRKEYGIKRNKLSRSKIHRILYDELIKNQNGKLKYDTKVQLNELIDQFLDDPFDSTSLVGQKTAEGYLTMTKGAYDKLLNIYMQNMYAVDRPTEGRVYRNNKIVDMTYEVLTHETSADKVLNPGGFDPQKRMGYAVSAYKDPSNTYTWEELMNMSVDQLKELSAKDKNLAFIDTHIQFYKQNSAAGALIGIFAVNRIAHAVIESDGYRINVNDACNITEPFTVAGMEFGGLMPFDMRYDRNGQLLGKVLGSLVASAVDAVKDPILNLMNINSNTANILNTLVRMGMPFDTAALFLSQNIITDVLREHSSENIIGNKSLKTVVKERIATIEESNNIDSTSSLRTEELTYDELVEGLKEGTNETIAYKTLLAFERFSYLAEAMRMPTFATRFNSISSAVGPLLIDNLITEHKMRTLNENSHIVDENGNTITMDDIFRKHPILDQFQRTIGLAKQLFGTNMPANSTGFRNLVEFIEQSRLGDNIFGDRKTLSTLSDFYQSYLLIKSGVIDNSRLKEYITEFPKKFLEGNYKEKYPDNAFIQAIKIGVEKNSGRAILTINTTGLDTQQKERLSTGWTDLHKVNPELSLDLFRYNFFRTGIGFSPKTFMGLVPVFIKERIPGYVESFRRLPEVVPEIVIDQFVRNNWNNDNLVPRKSAKSVTLRYEDNKAIVYKESQIRSMSMLPYFKIKRNNKDILYQRIEVNEDSVVFQEITPLGNNKEYLEISIDHITKALNESLEAIPIIELTSEIAESSLTEVEIEQNSIGENLLSDSQAAKVIYQVLDLVKGNREEANALLQRWKSNTNADVQSRMEFLEYQVKKLGIENFNREEVKQELEKYC